MASTEMIVRAGPVLVWSVRAVIRHIAFECLSRVVFQVDLVNEAHDFAISVVAAGGTDVMRALQLAAIGAFVRVARNQRVMRAAVVAARFRYFVLLDGHVTTSIPVGQMARYHGCPRLLIRSEPPVQPSIPMRARKYRDLLPGQAILDASRRSHRHSSPLS